MARRLSRAGDKENPSCSAASTTRFCIGPLTSPWPVATRLTVAMEQPAFAATSLTVGAPPSITLESPPAPSRPCLMARRS